MKFLQELMDIPTVWSHAGTKFGMKVIDQENEENVDDLNSLLGDGSEEEMPMDDEESIDSDDDGEMEYDDEGNPIEDQDTEEDKDPNKQGIIRFVKGAHLVYKRQNDSGSYDELWIYNIGNAFDDDMNIRKSILAGTDIDKNKTSSKDGSQNYSLKTLGNAQYLFITGLPQ